jgi:hypothetical protein
VVVLARMLAQSRAALAAFVRFLALVRERACLK